LIAIVRLVGAPIFYKLPSFEWRAIYSGDISAEVFSMSLLHGGRSWKRQRPFNDRSTMMMIASQSTISICLHGYI